MQGWFALRKLRPTKRFWVQDHPPARRWSEAHR